MINTCKLRFTYDRVSPESADDGDTSEAGWYVPGGWHFDVKGKPFDPADVPDPIECTGEECIREIESTVGCVDSVQVYGSKLTVYGSDSSIDYQTGEHTAYAAHVEADPRVLRIIAERLR